MIYTAWMEKEKIFEKNGKFQVWLGLIVLDCHIIYNNKKKMYLSMLHVTLTTKFSSHSVTKVR